MKSANVACEKSMLFSIRIVRLYQFLCSEQKEFVLSKQLLRCGTSIGANINEAQYAISKSDFLNKMHIALKECAEALYWLELLYRTNYLTEPQYTSLHADCRELHALLSSITKTTREALSK